MIDAYSYSLLGALWAIVFLLILNYLGIVFLIFRQFIFHGYGQALLKLKLYRPPDIVLQGEFRGKQFVNSLQLRLLLLNHELPCISLCIEWQILAAVTAFGLVPLLNGWSNHLWQASNGWHSVFFTETDGDLVGVNGFVHDAFALDAERVTVHLLHAFVSECTVSD